MNSGLCDSCVWVRKIENDRGSIFFHCGKSKANPRYPKYPRLPVLRCDGYELRSTDRLQSNDEAPGDHS